MKDVIKKNIPKGLIKPLSSIYQSYRRAVITESLGKLDPMKGNLTFVMMVGSTFDQRRPDAMMTCRMGYCHGFEALGIPYIIVDIHQANNILPKLPNPICFLYAVDLAGLSNSIIRTIRKYPTGIWVHPWFKDSKSFFTMQGLDYKVWTLNEKLLKKTLDVEAKFGFTGTVASGLNYFEEWSQKGLPMVSLPLACDTKVYCENENKPIHNFGNIDLAFVGGYWQSKGVQIDNYLKPWEDRLTVFGYSKWPYCGYGGQLKAELEPQLYRQAKVCPVINEPTVALMKGQINERVFKVLGAGGCPVVDAVPAYRELYSDDELLIAENVEHFHFLINSVLENEELNISYRKKGYEATLSRHTYSHRAIEFLRLCGLDMKMPESEYIIS